MTPTLPPKALGAVLDVLARATGSVAEIVKLSGTIQVLVLLANQEHPIGAVVPAPPQSSVGG